MPEAFVPDAPLSMITVLEDPLVPEEVDVLVEPVGAVLLVEPVNVLLVELDGTVLLAELDEVDAVEGENWTASAQVVWLLDWETITTFACPEKLYVPSRFHLPPFCN